MDWIVANYHNVELVNKRPLWHTFADMRIGLLRNVRSDCTQLRRHRNFVFCDEQCAAPPTDASR